MNAGINKVDYKFVNKSASSAYENVRLVCSQHKKAEDAANSSKQNTSVAQSSSVPIWLMPIMPEIDVLNMALVFFPGSMASAPIGQVESNSVSFGTAASSNAAALDECRLCNGNGKCHICNGRGWVAVVGIGSGTLQCEACCGDGRCTLRGGTGLH